MINKPKIEKLKLIMREMQNYKYPGAVPRKGVSSSGHLIEPSGNLQNGVAISPHSTSSKSPFDARIHIRTKVISVITNKLSTRQHKHSAIQIAYNFEHPFLLYLDEHEEFKLFFTIIPSDVSHQLISPMGKYNSILVDPLSLLGMRINHFLEYEQAFNSFVVSVMEKINIPSHKAMFDFGAEHATNRIMRQLNEITSEFPFRDMDKRIREALKKCLIKGGKELTLTNLAEWIYLSKSRSQHLFKQETGVQFRRYLKWIKTIEAVKYRYDFRSNLTEAAHMAGFSDLAHLSRTFKDMFGIPPSFFLEKTAGHGLKAH
jgi:AraC-like DNA-binding protein